MNQIVIEPTPGATGQSYTQFCEAGANHVYVLGSRATPHEIEDAIKKLTFLPASIFDIHDAVCCANLVADQRSLDEKRR